MFQIFKHPWLGRSRPHAGFLTKGGSFNLRTRKGRFPEARSVCSNSRARKERNIGRCSSPAQKYGQYPIPPSYPVFFLQWSSWRIYEVDITYLFVNQWIWNMKTLWGKIFFGGRLVKTLFACVLKWAKLTTWFCRCAEFYVSLHSMVDKDTSV